MLGTYFNSDTIVGLNVANWHQRDPSNWVYRPVLEHVRSSDQPSPLSTSMTMLVLAFKWLDLGDRLLKVRLHTLPAVSNC